MEHGLASLQPPPVNQSVQGGPTANHQPGRLLEAHLLGHARQAVRICQRVLGKPPAGNPQIRVHPVARLDVGPIADRLHQAGDFKPRNVGQGRPSEGAADHRDVPWADARAPHLDHCLSR